MSEQLTIGMFPVETPDEAERSCLAQADPFAALLVNYRLLHALALDLVRERDELENRKTT